VRKTAEDACFHHLRALNLRPLSKKAIARATEVVAELGRCIEDAGFAVGPPEVKNLGRGRAAFGFKRVPGAAPLVGRVQQRFLKASHGCERRVHLATRLSKIIANDRRDTVNGNL
jgi:hypothetical protein